MRIVGAALVVVVMVMVVAMVMVAAKGELASVILVPVGGIRERNRGVAVRDDTRGRAKEE